LWSFWTTDVSVTHGTLQVLAKFLVFKYGKHNYQFMDMLLPTTYYYLAFNKNYDLIIYELSAHSSDVHVLGLNYSRSQL